jgi:tRNA (guanine-N7-)-methyltransferase
MKRSPLPLYGRRRGHRLSASQQALLATLLPKITIALDPDQPGTLDPRRLFPPTVTDVWLEIGFGKGEHLAAQAKANPEIGFIGCEPYVNGVAGLLSQIRDHKLANIRIYPDDGRHVLSALSPKTLGRVFALHPDPWPKKRHAKRRLINPETLDALARAMKKGAELRLSSDHPAMVAWTLAHLLNRADFSWAAERAGDWREAPPDSPETRFAAKARGRRERPVFLMFKRA